MNGAALVAIVATIGNLLQGWDNATIAGIYSMSSDFLNLYCFAMNLVDWFPRSGFYLFFGDLDYGFSGN